MAGGQQRSRPELAGCPGSLEKHAVLSRRHFSATDQDGLCFSPQSPKGFLESYEEMLSYALRPETWATTRLELEGRGAPVVPPRVVSGAMHEPPGRHPPQVVCMSFFDIVLDFILMDAFEDLENPPASVLAVLRNRWLSDSFKETALATACWSVLKAKRRLLMVSDWAAREPRAGLWWCGCGVELLAEPLGPGRLFRRYLSQGRELPGGAPRPTSFPPRPSTEQAIGEGNGHPRVVATGLAAGLVPDGFISHFYSVSEHVSPVLAFGFLGPKPQLAEVCAFFKHQIVQYLRDMFDLDNVRYTSVPALADDILQLSRRRSEILLGYLGVPPASSTGLNGALPRENGSLGELQ
ncbi:Mitoguardin 2 [Saguinus oedipus]|uniref:Mitoguardin 2 n=1 Tax=Saguinus oedipus TaxID=9490 RepID=A0ABQ9WFK2_SAGOE|nr:Mitoguardin 2 [Saguinus oedipus]